MDSRRCLYRFICILISTKQYSEDHLPKIPWALFHLSYRHPSGATRRGFRIAPCGNVKRSRLHVAAGLDARREGQTAKCVEMRSAATPKDVVHIFIYIYIFIIYHILSRGRISFRQVAVCWLGESPSPPCLSTTWGGKDGHSTAATLYARAFCLVWRWNMLWATSGTTWLLIVVVLSLLGKPSYSAGWFNIMKHVGLGLGTPKMPWQPAAFAETSGGRLDWKWSDLFVTCIAAANNDIWYCIYSFIKCNFSAKHNMNT